MSGSTTESSAVRYKGLDGWPTNEVVGAILEGQLAAAASAAGAAAAIGDAVDRACERLGVNGRLIYLGAGTSGRIAVQDAAELLPTFAWPSERALALMAGGEAAFVKSIEGAEDDRAAAAAALDAVDVGAADVVIGVAASGNTPFTVAGVTHARNRGALTIGVLNNASGALADAAELPLIVATGAEVVAGSTRMKAGTAQKIVLNAFSTALMVRLGFVYRGRMVEMRPTNEKLRQRARVMVAELTGADAADAAAALAAAGGSIKLAVVMLSLDLGRAAAEKLLRNADGHLARALAG